MKEVDALPEDPEEADFTDRVDLRGETIFTIDGEDAKDFDDAIAIRELGGGRVEIGVHIADVVVGELVSDYRRIFDVKNSSQVAV